MTHDWIPVTFYRENHALLLRHGHGWRCLVGQSIWAVSRVVGRIADRVDPVYRR